MQKNSDRFAEIAGRLAARGLESGNRHNISLLKSIILDFGVDVNVQEGVIVKYFTQEGNENDVDFIKMCHGYKEYVEGTNKAPKVNCKPIPPSPQKTEIEIHTQAAVHIAKRGIEEKSIKYIGVLLGYIADLNVDPRANDGIIFEYFTSCNYESDFIMGCPGYEEHMRKHNACVKGTKVDTLVKETATVLPMITPIIQPLVSKYLQLTEDEREKFREELTSYLLKDVMTLFAKFN